MKIKELISILEIYEKALSADAKIYFTIDGYADICDLPNIGRIGDVLNVDFSFIEYNGN